MTCKPRQISGNLPFDAIPKDYNRYCDRLVGNASVVLDHAFVVNLTDAISTRNSPTTGITDSVLIEYPSLTPSYDEGDLQNYEVGKNYLLNSLTPVTQTTESLLVGFYTLSVYGAGSALASGGTATITGASAATEGSPNTIEVTVAGTVTVTKTGVLSRFQLEGGSIETAHIITEGATAQRAIDFLTLPTPGIVQVDGWAVKIGLTPHKLHTGGFPFVWYQDGTNRTVIFATATSFLLLSYKDGEVTTSATFNYAHQVGVKMWLEFYFRDGNINIRAYKDGETVPAFPVETTIVQIPIVTPLMAYGGQAGVSNFFSNYGENDSIFYDSFEDTGW